VTIQASNRVQYRDFIYNTLRQGKRDIIEDQRNWGKGFGLRLYHGFIPIKASPQEEPLAEMLTGEVAEVN
jgi:hypothetical protein